MKKITLPEMHILSNIRLLKIQQTAVSTQNIAKNIKVSIENTGVHINGLLQKKLIQIVQSNQLTEPGIKKFEFIPQKQKLPLDLSSEKVEPDNFYSYVFNILNTMANIDKFEAIHELMELCPEVTINQKLRETKLDKLECYLFFMIYGQLKVTYFENNLLFLIPEADFLFKNGKDKVHFVDRFSTGQSNLLKAGWMVYKEYQRDKYSETKPYLETTMKMLLHFPPCPELGYALLNNSNFAHSYCSKALGEMHTEALNTISRLLKDGKVNW